ncbi:flavodoxin family protein [Candidatus Woesearchaeota archaeon]|nr:MAG: flavodoxin family protein [Candidatus Woesearchaeota archaeon]
MGTLVIYAHPKTQGHCPWILKQVELNLKRMDEEYEVIDLYKRGYNSVLKAEELYTAKKYEVSEENKKIQEKIKSSKKLIFIYPVWWGTMPAILKGFFDRVFVARYAFKYVKGVPIGLLKDVKALVFITSGAHETLSRIFQSPVKNIKYEILRFCGIKAKVVQFGNSRELDDKRKNMINKKVAKTISRFY